MQLLMDVSGLLTHNPTYIITCQLIEDDSNLLCVPHFQEC